MWLRTWYFAWFVVESGLQTSCPRPHAGLDWWWCKSVACWFIQFLGAVHLRCIHIAYLHTFTPGFSRFWTILNWCRMELSRNCYRVFLSVSSDINREQRSHQDDVKGTILTRPSLDIPRLSFQHLKRVWILILTILIHDFGIKYIQVLSYTCWILLIFVNFWNKMVFCLQEPVGPVAVSRIAQDSRPRCPTWTGLDDDLQTWQRRGKIEVPILGSKKRSEIDFRDLRDL